MRISSKTETSKSVKGIPDFSDFRMIWNDNIFIILYVPLESTAILMFLNNDNNRNVIF